jgi:hypothetical protein
MQHEWGRKVAASGYHRSPGLQGGAEPALLGKTRARLLVQPGGDF